MSPLESSLRSVLLPTCARLGNGEFPIGTVRNYRLTRFKVELSAVQMHRNYVWLERHQTGDAANFRIGLPIRPCRQACVTDIVVAAQTFVRAKGLMFHESECGRSNDAPSRRRSNRTVAAGLNYSAI